MPSRGDIALARFPFTDQTGTKLRPVLILAEIPRHYRDFIVLFISSQLSQQTPNLDGVITYDTIFGELRFHVIVARGRRRDLDHERKRLHEHLQPLIAELPAYQVYRHDVHVGDVIPLRRAADGPQVRSNLELIGIELLKEPAKQSRRRLIVICAHRRLLPQRPVVQLPAAIGVLQGLPSYRCSR